MKTAPDELVHRNSSLIQSLSTVTDRISRRLVPDPLIFAAGLTGTVMLVAILLPENGQQSSQTLTDRCQSLVLIWFDGLWQPNLLAFGMQMCVILLAGFGLASAPVMRRLIQRLANIPTTTTGAVGLISAWSCIGCWINWGFGLVSAGLLASALRTRIPSPYTRSPILVAAAYCGMMIWHGGLSGSAPLKVARDGVVPIQQTGLADDLPLQSPSPIDVPIRSTTLAAGNLILTVVLVLGIPAVMRKLAGAALPLEPPRPSGLETVEASVVEDEHDGGAGASLLQQRWVSATLGALLLITVAVRFKQYRFDAIGLNQVNTIFLGLGMLLHAHLGGLLRAFAEGGRAIVGIVVLFPFYAGIQGLMRDTGIAQSITELFIAGGISIAESIGIDPFITFVPSCFVSAGLVNVFVPSGGGQWIVQGPLMCGAAQGLGVSIPQTVMAISFGDQITNMIQPFWAIPLMGLTGVKPSEFLGACMVLMIIFAPVILLGLLILF